MRLTVTPRVAALLLSATAVSVAACNDATAPGATAPPPGPAGPAVTVTISTPPAPDYFRDGDTAQAVRCTPKLRANVAGSSGATWTGATIRWFMGTDRVKPVDSIRVAPSQVAAWWGDARVDAADGETISLELTARLPFSADISFQYRADSGDRSASVSFDCGPVVTSATPLPTIVGPTLVAHPASLHPGDTIQVEYAAAADGTLWETYVALYGVCNARQRFPEMARPATRRVVTFVLPPSCRPSADASLGELGLTVVAFDAGGRPVVSDVGTGRSVVTARQLMTPALRSPRDADEHHAGAAPRLDAARADRGLSIRYVHPRR